jgi:NAD(P)-dependent dehydrogenase (short-subunit alcohol dehydrogenase family)
MPRDPDSRGVSGNRFAADRVIVTGAASGIGRELVTILLSEGAHVVGVDVNPDGIPAGSERVQADLAVADEVTNAMDLAVALLGGVDILCNNAGIGSTRSVVDCSAHEWDHVFDVNVRATFLGTKAVLPSMLAQQHGVIVNTASVAGMIGLPDRAAYCASKGAVIALTKQVAIQYATAGVRCNCVCPGTVDSPWVQRLVDEAPDPAQRRADLIARQPMGRLATPTEVAAAIAYLAGPDSAFMTGTELVIDGGITAA